MSDLRTLREAAKKATPGPWATQRKSVLASGKTDTYAGRVLGSICYCEPTTRTNSEGRTWSTSGSAENNAAFIALANPSTILSLITTIRDLERENERLLDTSEGLQADLQSALEVIFNRCGAIEWLDLNYPGFSNKMLARAEAKGSGT